MSRLPNLFLIGAKKSASSSLWEYIRTHPQIYSPEIKEPRYFHDHLYCEDLKDYLSLYDKAENQEYLLDGSPQYTIDPNSADSAKRIFEFNPHSKIIYILRDPSARMISDYLFSVWRHKEVREALDVFSAESVYSRTSDYAKQIRPYWEMFGADSVYIDTFEALVLNPQEFCKRLFSWLNIDCNFVPNNLNEHLVKTPVQVGLFDEDARLVKIWRIVRRHHSLVNFFPLWFRRRCHKFLTVRKRVDVKSQEFARVKEQIRQIWAEPLRKSIADLEQLTGKKFLEWPSRAWPNPVAAELSGELLAAKQLKPLRDTWSESLEESTS